MGNGPRDPASSGAVGSRLISLEVRDFLFVRMILIEINVDELVRRAPTSEGCPLGLRCIQAR